MGFFKLDYLVQMSSNLLKSAVWNIEGLSLDKIKDPHFINIISKFHLISFVETWTNDNDNEIKIPGFHFVNGNNRKKNIKRPDAIMVV